MVQSYPVYDPAKVNTQADMTINELKAMVDAIRNLRSGMLVPPSKKFHWLSAAVTEKLAQEPRNSRLISRRSAVLKKLFSPMT